MRSLLLGAGCLMALFIAQTNLSEQMFWIRQTAAMESSYQHALASSVKLDKILASYPPFTQKEKESDEHLLKQDRENLGQLQALCDSVKRDGLRTLLMFLLLQLGLLGFYLTFWYFVRNPQAGLLAMMIKRGRQRGSFIS